MNDALLHNSCKLFSKDPTIIKSALHFEPESIRQAVPTVCHCHGACARRPSSAPNASSVESLATPSERPETYKYAINIALKHDATLEVLDLLAAARPDVLTEPHGPLGAGTLGIALTSASRSSVQNDQGDDSRTTTAGRDDETRVKLTELVVRLLLAANPKSATVVDRYQNAPIHYAARGRQVSLNAVSQIYRHFPSALHQRNFNGLTPLQVAEQCSFVPEHVLDHLQMLSYSEKEQDLERNLDEADDELLRMLESEH